MGKCDMIPLVISIRSENEKENEMRHYKTMKKVLAVLGAVGILCGAQGMTVFAGTMGVGAAGGRAQAAGPGGAASISENSYEQGEETEQSVQPAQPEQEEPEAGQKAEAGGEQPLQVNYSTFIVNTGWTSAAADNSISAGPAGTWVTAMKANLINIPQGEQIGIRYQVNLSGSGWLNWESDGADAGNTADVMPLEAVRMELTGSQVSRYDLYYKVYQNGSWTEWASNGAAAGVEGAGLRVDGLQASITAKGAGAPSAGMTAGNVDPGRPMIALTFDDGPRASVTNRILDSLQANGGRATFFMVGTNVNANAAVIQRMTAQGCEVGNHTHDHKYISKISADGIVSQISSTNQKIAAACGVSPVVMRPPGGYIDANSLAVLGSLGMPAIMWSIDTRDWQHRNSSRTIETVLSQVKDGDIILMHDIYDATADAAQVLIPELTARGYQLVTVSELAAARGGAAAGQKYSQFRP